MTENMKQLQDLMLSYQRKSERQLDDFIDDNIDKLKTIVKDSKAINDSYGNSLLSIGNDDKVADFTNYSFNNDTLNYLLWLSLYNSSWVFKRAIDKPAQDEIKCGIQIQGIEQRKDEVNRLLKKYRFDLIQLLQWGALFGGSVVVCMFDNMKDEEYALPMTDKVKSAKVMRMYVTDRWYGCAPTYDDTVKEMTNIDYGKPKYYDITFADGHQMRVHHDYIIRYEHRTAPKLVKMGQLQGWGYAEGSHILNELMRDDKLKSSVQSLVDKALIEVIKMSGMRGVFMGADEENNEQLKQRLEMVNWGRNFNSLTFLDKEDEYSQNTFGGLGGLSDLLQQNMWQISAALEMQGVLFGDLKQGFSNDSQALERYSETIHERCESYVRPVFEKLLKIIYQMLGINEKIEFEFDSLARDIQDDKNSRRFRDFADLCSTLLNDGVIDVQQYAIAVNKYFTKGIMDFGFTQEKIEKLAEPDVNEDFDITEDVLKGSNNNVRK